MTEAASPPIERRALISACERYRYLLRRSWSAGPTVAFVMLNPSTADAQIDDPTIRRCCGFARTWGFGAVDVVNLFAWRSTEPKALLAAADPIGPWNDDHVRVAVSMARLVVVGWGAAGPAKLRELVRARAAAVAPLLGDSARCLGRTADGSPRHPLFVRADAQLVEFAK